MLPGLLKFIVMNLKLTPHATQQICFYVSLLYVCSYFLCFPTLWLFTHPLFTNVQHLFSPSSPLAVPLPFLLHQVTWSYQRIKSIVSHNPPTEHLRQHILPSFLIPQIWVSSMAATSHMWLGSLWNEASPNWDILKVQNPSWSSKTIWKTECKISHLICLDWLNVEIIFWLYLVK